MPRITIFLHQLFRLVSTYFPCKDSGSSCWSREWECFGSYIRTSTDALPPRQRRDSCSLVRSHLLHCTMRRTGQASCRLALAFLSLTEYVGRKWCRFLHSILGSCNCRLYLIECSTGLDCCADIFLQQLAGKRQRLLERNLRFSCFCRSTYMQQ